MFFSDQSVVKSYIYDYRISEINIPQLPKDILNIINEYLQKSIFYISKKNTFNYCDISFDICPNLWYSSNTTETINQLKKLLCMIRENFRSEIISLDLHNEISYENEIFYHYYDNKIIVKIKTDEISRKVIHDELLKYVDYLAGYV